MRTFQYLEILLYIFPILEMIIIDRFFRPYLYFGNGLHLSVANVVLPVLLVGIHIFSTFSLGYSLLPHFLLLLCVAGLVQTFYFHKTRRPYHGKHFVDFFFKLAFLLGLFVFYLLVGARLFLLIRG